MTRMQRLYLREREGRRRWRIRRLLLIGATIATLTLGGGVALADPDFGPGNSSKGPHDPGALCHPPGQTADFPACKE